MKQLNINGVEYVPLSMLKVLSEPGSKDMAALVAAATEWTRVEASVSEPGGLELLDDATTKLKRAVRALERRARAA